MTIHKIFVSCHLSLTASTVNEVIEVEIDDDATPAEIIKAKEAAAKEWLFEQIEYTWSNATEED